MNKLTITILTLLFFQFTNAFSQEKKTEDSILEKEKFHPIYVQYGLDTLKTKTGEIRKIDSISIAPLKVIHFLFRERNQDKPWPYGFGYLIADNTEQKNKVVWFNLIYGDFGPHTFSWVDFDNDGDKDLYHLSGFEDVFESHLYLNQINTNLKHPFKPVYKNNLAYCALVDFDKDGIPEIINQAKKLDSEERYIDKDWSFEIGNENRLLISEEYDRIIGEFNECNFDYNMPNHYKEFSISISSDVNIFKVINDSIIDVSTNYPDHFCFRNKILKRISNPGKKVKSWFTDLETKYSQICNEKK